MAATDSQFALAEQSTEQHFFFENQGQMLLAVAHIPPQPRPGALVFLHGWAGYRAGPHQMFVKMARRAAEQGFLAARFDFRGRGDSQGDPFATTLTTMISDTAALAGVLAERYGVERMALIGDCSGSEVAIGAASLVQQVDSLVLWSAPIVGGERSAVQRAKQRHIVRQYLAKLFRRETWAKLLGGRLRLDMIRKALSTGGKGAGEAGAEIDKRIDWLKCFAGFAGERLFIYGGNDPTMSETVAHYQHLSAQVGCDFPCHIVAGSNHAFYSLAWEEEVIRTSLNSLEKQYPWPEAPDDH